MSASSASLLLAAVMVGFAAAWLVFEIRRAWSPEAVRVSDHDPAAAAAAEDVAHLAEELTQLRAEIAAVRLSEIEVALRNRQRELQLAAALEAISAQVAQHAEPVEPDTEPDTEVDDTPSAASDDIVPRSRVGTGGRS
jgi:TolA-binding protein